MWRVHSAAAYGVVSGAWNDKPSRSGYSWDVPVHHTHLGPSSSKLLSTIQLSVHNPSYILVVELIFNTITGQLGARVLAVVRTILQMVMRQGDRILLLRLKE